MSKRHQAWRQVRLLCSVLRRKVELQDTTFKIHSACRHLKATSPARFRQYFRCDVLSVGLRRHFFVTDYFVGNKATVIKGVGEKQFL